MDDDRVDAPLTAEEAASWDALVRKARSLEIEASTEEIVAVFAAFIENAEKDFTSSHVKNTKGEALKGFAWVAAGLVYLSGLLVAKYGML